MTARHYRVVFVVFALILLASAFAITTLEFDTDVLNLLPAEDPVVKTFRDTLHDFGSIDLLLVVVHIPKGVEVEGYEDFADDLAVGLAKLPTIEYVDHRLGEPTELLASFIPRSILFMDEEGRNRIETVLTDEGMAAKASELRQLITSPQSLVLKDLLLVDPLGIGKSFIERLGDSSGALDVDMSEGYYLSRDHEMLLILAKPVKPAQDISFDEVLVAQVEEVVAAARQDHGGEENGPRVSLGGGYLTALDDASLIKGDVMINAGTSLVIVLALFIFAFRRFSPLLYAFIPLVAGLILAFGACAILLGSLSSATSGMAALLVGLGIDFVIVTYARYVEERRDGAVFETAIDNVMSSSGKAVVAGGITSAATFYAFLVTEFTGLRQMGILAGTGILVCMVAVLTLLPAMFAWSEAHHRARESQPNLYLHSFGAEKLVRFCFRNPVATIFVGFVLTVGSIIFALRLDFQDNIQEMRSPQNRGIQVVNEVAEHFGTSFEYMTLVLHGETSDEVLDLAANATEGVVHLVDQGVLDGYDSISRLIPSPKSQVESLAWLREKGASVGSPVEIRARFEAHLLEEGLNPKALKRGLDLFEEALGVDDTIRLEALNEEGNAETNRLLERYIRKNDEGWKGAIKLYPPPKRWKREAPPDVIALADSLGPQVELTGVNVVSQTLRTRVRRDATIAALLGFFLVAILLWMDFGSWRDSFLSLGPLIIGILWMLGLMSLFGIKMNFMNIFVTTMIIGIGVDYGIHMLHRFNETSDLSPVERKVRMSETGKAIVLAALSTVVGFGSMSLSRYPGLQSIGFVAILGALTTALVSITLLPAILGLSLRREKEEEL